METKVASIIKGNMISVSSSTKPAAALKLLESSNIPMLPVIEDGRLVGIVTGDRLRERAGSGSSVKSIMLHPLFIEKNAGIDHAIKYIMKHKISRVPVVESSIGMRCIGIVTASELLKAKKLMQQ